MCQHSSIHSLQQLIRELQVYAIYGSKDTKRLPDVAVLKSIFPNFGVTIVPGGGHPVYLHDPGLFNRLLIEVAHNISTTALLPVVAGGSEKDSTVGDGVRLSAADSTVKETVRKADGFVGPETTAPFVSHWMVAVSVGITCIGLAAIFRVCSFKFKLNRSQE
jgi:hypothetical protein